MIRNIGVARTLKLSFLFGVMIILMMGAISLISWYSQTKQVSYILDDYFPKTNAIIKLEEDISRFIVDLNKLTASKNNYTAKSMIKQLHSQLSEIEESNRRLILDKGINLEDNLYELSELISKLDYIIDRNLLIEKKKQELLTRIQWVNDDFNSETIAFFNELHWQQNSINSLHNNDDVSNEIQEEFNLIYHLSILKEQIRNELMQFIYDLNEISTGSNYSDFIQLAAKLNEEVKSINSNKLSILTLNKMVLSLYDFADNELRNIIDIIIENDKLYADVLARKNIVIEESKKIINQHLNDYKDKFNTLNITLKTETRNSGIILLFFISISCFAIFIINSLYIRKRVTDRFSQLINNISELNNGKNNIDLDVNGGDEISQISKFLKKYIKITQEKIDIERNLRKTQDELIQTSKLAVVGQTMTMLSHEINQPLNAITIYLFNLKRILKQSCDNNSLEVVNKIEQLIIRITKIIKGLRHFTRKIEEHNLSENVDIRTVIYNAWEILESVNTSKRLEVFVNGNSHILGNNILLEQVFINIFTNSIEATKGEAAINIDIIENINEIQIIISDNGCGWDIDKFDRISEPFYTSKDIGLGLGITICKMIIERLNGHLSFASTINKNAVVILTFPIENDDE
ncbi:ATP-binding protein [Ursidibacter sp. B-7004-1]